ncbi:Glycosyl hydrolases family 43 [Parapedobacter composti]|uniref:Glycosyl hydrolases family 43 n=1 Tax=Parapedobacter composti TaxID=623281 RepID=A0A1I1GV30_9SPHI|nr:glycoside hydrolase family 43 protein [Parapedobacter composti]SFC15326.1 Glycosyl hydrolases family 43 [Parapedobacter composti]
MDKQKILIAGLLLFAALIDGCTEQAGKDTEAVYFFTSFREPATDGMRLLYSHDGLRWDTLGGVFIRPGIGDQRIMRDPSVVRGPDGTFHLVWTTGWRGTKGFGYASSKDLIRWSNQRSIDVMAHEPTTVNVWAPELFYDDEADRFIIIWASTVPYRFEKGMEEEDNNHRMYYTTTKDFKTFTGTKLFLDPGFSVIDAVITKREKADYVLVLKDNTRPNRNLRVAFADNPLGPYTEVGEPFTGHLTEGPTVLKRGDDWYIYFDAYRTHTYGAVKTRDFVHFTDATEEISVPRGHKHGTIFAGTQADLQRIQDFLKRNGG